MKIFSFIALTVTLVLSGTASAAVLDLKKIPPLSAVQAMPEAEFDAATQAVEAVPFGDPHLAFRVRLPKGWTAEIEPPGPAENGGLSSRVPGIFARYVSPSRMHLRSFFTLEAVELEYEISARNWFLNYILGSGHTLEGLSELSRRRVEAVYVEVERDTTYAVRVAAVINGPRMVIARYYVPQEDFAGEKTMQAQAVGSFALANTVEGGVEEHKTFAFMDQSYFDYPASWNASAPEIFSIERMRAMVANVPDSGDVQGQIDVYLTSKLVETTLADEVKRYADRISVDRYTRGALIESVDYNYDDGMLFGRTEIYQMTPQPVTMIWYELAVTVLEGEDYYYVIGLLTPERKEEFYSWARNMEAYRLVVESMRRTLE